MLDVLAMVVCMCAVKLQYRRRADAISEMREFMDQQSYKWFLQDMREEMSEDEHTDLMRQAGYDVIQFRM